jgi:hypothetical protein
MNELSQPTPDQLRRTALIYVLTEPRKLSSS